jgi:chloramphenicol-sensitive protein RarD
MFFAFAARRLRLATVGLLQYIAPTGHFFIGIFLYDEPFTAADAVTFACIWTGLALYTTDMWLKHRKQLTLKRSLAATRPPQPWHRDQRD